MPNAVRARGSGSPFGGFALVGAVSSLGDGTGTVWFLIIVVGIGRIRR
jgi:hypothetical protein